MGFFLGFPFVCRSWLLITRSGDILSFGDGWDEVESKGPSSSMALGFSFAEIDFGFCNATVNQKVQNENSKTSQTKEIQ